MIIQELKQIVTRLNPLTGQHEAPKQEKQYLLLLYFRDEESSKDFEIITGRSGTFGHLLENIDSIDLLKSHVMLQSMPLDKALTAYTFMRLCLEDRISQEEIERIEFDAEMLEAHMGDFYDEDEEYLENLYYEEINQPK